jgi:hypothetical protein
VVNGRDPCEVADRHALAVEALRGGVDVCGLLQVEYGAFGFGLQRGELGERLDDSRSSAREAFSAQLCGLSGRYGPA